MYDMYKEHVEAHALKRLRGHPGPSVALPFYT